MYVKYSIGNIVNNIVITMYHARWVLEISRGDHFVNLGFSNNYTVYLKLI